MKKLLVLVFAIALCLGVLCVGASADYSGTPKEPTGSGTAAEPYQIGTAEELYWFAGLVNGTLNGVEKDTDANAVLTADITINENVLNENGTLNDTPTYTWTPIGSFASAHYFPQYTGTFDGQGHTISGLYYSGSGYGGLFGCVGSGGQVKNVKVADSYINGKIYVGGVCGANNGTITNCSFDGSVIGDTIALGLYVGGVCGLNNGTVEDCSNSGTVTCNDTEYTQRVRAGGVCGGNGGTISSCYNAGAVTSSGTNYIGGVCGENNGTITNCYWLSGTATKGIGTGTGEATSKTAEEFASGEVAWLLNGGNQMNGPWRQNLGEGGDKFPVLDSTHRMVHFEGDDTYINDEHSYDNDGFCVCGAYEPAKLDGGVYQISNAGQLYWFAQTVNEGDYDANAELTNDITINENVLNDAGNVNSNSASSFTQWTPICGKKIGLYDYTEYTGTFDGQGYTISGLYYYGSSKYVGLFGYVGSNGRVQNVKVADSYISNSEWNGRTGGVCGYNGGTITNCSFSGSVTCNNTNTYVGGVCGGNAGTTENCYNAGSVTCVGSEASVGGVCGYNYSGSAIRNCYNTGAVNGKNDGNGYFYAGGVCGNNQTTGSPNTIENCYNTGSVTVIVTGSGNDNIYAGGVCGFNSQTITNCYNTGSVTVSVTGSGNGNICAGGVCGYNYDGTITNCYNTGDVTGSGTGVQYLYVGGVCGYNNRATITNCYWLSGKADGGVGTGSGTATEKTKAQFASGEVAWLLNSNQENGPWRQNLSDERDDYPVLDSTHKEAVKLTVDSTVSYLNKGDSFSGETNKTYFKADVAIELPYIVNEDTELTSAAIYTVTVVYDNGTAEKTEQVVDGKSFKLPAAPSKSGYTFVGWSDGNETYDPSQDVTVTGDKTFTAVWKQLFTVTVVYDNGTADTKEQVVDGGSFKLPAEPSRSGYTFVGWSDGTNTYDPGDSVPITGNVTFTAVWQAINIPDPNGITVTQPANGTIRVNPSNGSTGTLITVTATPDEGYELAYITVDGEKITGNTFRMPDKAVTVSAVFVPVTFPFTDVKSGDWFYDAVAYVYANGLMDGTSATTFEPNANMTRAMVWAILARIDGETVTGAAWADTARAWAMAEGVSDGTDPNGLVTREQFATMLYRYAVAKGYDVSIGESTNILSYADFASISEYAIPAMQWACGSGIVTGVTDSTLAPQGTATRAQCAAMLMRCVEL